MAGSYSIQVDAPRGLLCLGFAGLWSEATFDRFDRDLDAERERMAAAGLSPDWPRVLIDTAAFGVQTQPVATRFKARVARFHADRRLAFVTGEGQLTRLQLGRIAAIEDHRFFATRHEALAWLLA